MKALVNDIVFDGFAHLTGNTDEDIFSIDRRAGVNDSISGVINGGGGTSRDVVNISDLTSDSAILVAIGENNDGDFNLVGFEEVNASNGEYALIGDNVENTWILDGTNAGTVAGLEFTGFAHLTGGSANDEFIFDTDDSITGIIDGGNGTSTPDSDTVNLTAYDAAVLVSLDLDAVSGIRVQNVEHINANSTHVANNRIEGTNRGNTWDIDGTNAGVINGTTRFTGFANLSGSSGIDTFNFGQYQPGVDDRITGIIDGGDNTADVVNLIEMSGDVVVALHDDLTVEADLNVTGVENVLGNTSLSRSNTLIASNNTNDWIINGTNSGQLGNVAFSGFENLTGGSEQDTFRLDGNDAVTGLINGGGSLNDSLNIIGLARSVSVAIGTETDADINVVGIEGIIAADNNNTLIAESEVNIWNIGLNDVSQDAGRLQTAGYTVSFSGFANLQGGDDMDVFNFNREGDRDDMISGVINGGGARDIVNITDLEDLNTVAIGAVNEGDLNLVAIDELNATSPNRYVLQADNENNTWTIIGTDAGELNGMVFDGFGRLVGGNANDHFVIGRQTGASEDDRVTGFIDGGEEPSVGRATDSVDLTGMNEVVTVSLDTVYEADLYLSRIETLEAADGNNVLVGSNAVNSWSITDTNQGVLNGMAFTNFANLIGRGGVDTFLFSDDGRVTGLVDGGEQPNGLRDVVDMSELSVVHVVVGDTNSGFINIEEYRGSDRLTESIITAADLDNDWLIDGRNSGSITDSNGNTVYFSDFNILEGGSLDDQYTLAGGSVTGEIRAGDGDDSMVLDLANGLNGEVTFIGGEHSADGGDFISIAGGAEDVRFDVSYQANADGSAELTYDILVGETERTYQVNYLQTENISDDVFANELEINGVANSLDRFWLANNNFRLNDFAEVDYANKESVTVNAEIVGETFETVTIQGEILINNTFTINNASVVAQDENALINANNQIIFAGTGSIGSVDQRLTIDTNSVQLNNLRGDTFLAQVGDLVLASMESPAGIVDITATGSIRSSSGAALSTSNALRLEAADDIQLANAANSLAGELNLFAGGEYHHK